jgi:PAS domain-containing protein
MSDLFILDLLPIVFLAAAIVLAIYFWSKSKQKYSAETQRGDLFAEEFRKIFFSTVSEVIAAYELEKSLSAIANGMMQAFDGSVFIFSRSGELANLVCHAASDIELISDVLAKLGIRFEANAIPLGGAREKVFAGGYAEFEDPFPLIGDLVTSAACRRIQNEIRFGSISTISVKTESGDYLALVLLPERIHGIRSFIGEFGALINSAVYLSNMKKKLSQIETNFDEQITRIKNEFSAKEGFHVGLYNDMPIPAGVLDEGGVIVEANRALKDLFLEDARHRQAFSEQVDAIGQPFSSIMEEKDQRNFAENLRSPSVKGESNFPLVVCERHFKVTLVRPGGGDRIVAYLHDETVSENLRIGLQKTIDELRKENGLAERLIAEERKYSEDIVRSFPVPVIAVFGDKVEFASESARQILSITDGESLDEFSSRNKISTLTGMEPAFETEASGSRTFSVSRWEIGKYCCYLFSEITEFKRAEDGSQKSSFESGKLLESTIPSACVKENKIDGWNKSFGNLFKDFLATGNGFDEFLSYLNESPDSIKSELSSNGTVTRTIRTSDLKSWKVRLSSAEDSIFVFIEDITEQESLRQQWQQAHSLLANCIEFFSEEPTFVLENGVVSAANLAARDKLSIKLGEPLSIDTPFAGFGAADRNSTVELRGKTFRIESATLDGSAVFHLRRVAEEVAPRPETNKLEKHYDFPMELATSERYEDILTSVKEVLGKDVVLTSICTGILYLTKECADVYSLTVSTPRIESAMSLGLNPSDVSVAKKGGMFSKSELPETDFSNIVSEGDSRLAIESTIVGDVCGFVSVTLPEESRSDDSKQEFSVQNGAGGAQTVEVISKALKVASAITVDMYTRLSAQKNL